MASNQFKSFQIDSYSDEPITFQLLRKRKMENKDTIIIITGEKRTGKSYGAIKLAEKLQNNFDASKQVFFDLKPFMYFMKEKTDSVCILDEISVNYNARTWYDLQNKIYSTILTTQGFRRNIIIMTLPHISALDKTSLFLSHFLFTTLRVPYIKCYRIKSTQISKKIYPIAFEILKMKLASKKNIDAYEKMKKEWNDNKLEKDLDFLNMIENPETYEKVLNYKEYLKSFKLGLIPEKEVIKKLKRIGYGDVDSKMMVDTVKKELEAERLIQEKRNQRMEEKRLQLESMNKFTQSLQTKKSH